MLQKNLWSGNQNLHSKHVPSQPSTEYSYILFLEENLWLQQCFLKKTVANITIDFGQDYLYLSRHKLSPKEAFFKNQNWESWHLKQSFKCIEILAFY